MPFLAEHPESGVALKPADVGDKFRRRQELLCPYCGDTLKYKKHGTNDAGERVSRAHFWHTENVGNEGGPGGCAKGGESAEHENWKMVLGEILKEGYEKDEYYVEKTIGRKVADVAIDATCDGKRGIAAEYQYKNRDKDYLATTKEYLKHGYAVHWVFNTNSTYEMLFAAKEELEPYFSSSLFLGEQNLTKTGENLIELGSQIWFGNFTFCVNSPADIGPFVPKEEGTLWSGEFACVWGGRSRYPYLISRAAEEPDIDPPKEIVTTDGWDWPDVWNTYYADSGGGGLLEHFKEEISDGAFFRRGPIPEMGGSVPRL